MLVLSRKTHEVIRIGKDIVIRVEEINGGKVRLSIDAPNDVKICKEKNSPPATTAKNEEISNT